jgi:integrase
VNYTVPGQKPTKIGLGSFPVITLADARERTLDIQRGLRQNPPIDPKQARDQVRTVRASGSALTFGEFAAERIAILITGLKHPVSVDRWQNTFPKKFAPIADMPIADIETSDIERLVLPDWLKRPAAAREFLSMLERIFRAAKAHKKYIGQNPAAFRDNLADLLPNQTGNVRGPQASLDYSKVPAFVTDLIERGSMSAKALLLLILTASRTAETIGMRWSEIDFDAATWTLSKKRMKNNLKAVVPLSPQAIAILREIKATSLCDTFVFPGAKPGTCLHPNTLRTLLQRDLKRSDITVHGFRASFRTWGAEVGDYSSQVLEFCMHHIKGESAMVVYLRGTALDKRRVVMDAWANFVLAKRSRKPQLRVVA